MHSIGVGMAIGIVWSECIVLLQCCGEQSTKSVNQLLLRHRYRVVEITCHVGLRRPPTLMGDGSKELQDIHAKLGLQCLLLW